MEQAKVAPGADPQSTRRPSPSPRGRGEGLRGSPRSHLPQAPRDEACSKRLPLTLTLTLSPFRGAARGEGTVRRVSRRSAFHLSRASICAFAGMTLEDWRATRNSHSSCPRRRASTQACVGAGPPLTRRPSPSPRERGEGRGEGQRGSPRSHLPQGAPRDDACSKRLPLTLTLSPFRGAARGEGILGCAPQACAS